MTNKTGSPVEGDNFYGRESEIEYVWGRLQGGNNLVLSAPRRVGKSSFAKKMLALAREKGWETLEIDLEQVHSEMEFVARFVDALRQFSWWDKVKDAGQSLLEKLPSVKVNLTLPVGEATLEWQAKKADLYAELRNLLHHEKDTLIFFDELSVLLSDIVQGQNGTQQVGQFLHWLRSLRQVSGTRIRWIFCSSVGIDNFTMHHHLSDTMNDVPPYKIGPFTVANAEGLIVALEKSENLPLGEAIRQQMMEKLVYLLPYFIQVLFEKMNMLVKTEGAAINQDLVPKAYEEIIEANYLNTWIERLKEQYLSYEADAFLLLKHICQEKEGSKRENLLNLLQAKHQDIDKAEDTLAILLRMLKNDGYLADENGRYLFRSPLIRDFWYNYHVK